MKFGRSRLVASIEQLTGRPCVEAIPARSGGKTWILVVAAIPIFVLSNVFVMPVVGVIPGGIFAGGLIGALSALLNDLWVVARVDDTVVLARSKKLYVEAVAVEAVVPLPLPPGALVTEGIMATLTIEDHELRIAPGGRARLKDIIGPGSY